MKFCVHEPLLSSICTCRIFQSVSFRTGAGSRRCSAYWRVTALQLHVSRRNGQCTAVPQSAALQRRRQRTINVMRLRLANECNVERAHLRCGGSLGLGARRMTVGER